SLWVHSSPSGASASPDNSVAAGAVTCPTSCTVALRHSAGASASGAFALALVVGGGSGLRALPPQPATNAATISHNPFIPIEDAGSGDACAASGRRGETTAGPFFHEFTESSGASGASWDANGQRGVERRPLERVVDREADMVAPRPGGDEQIAGARGVDRVAD